jgi:CBS domain-containing protein
MSIGRICSREVHFAETHESVQAVARRMRHANVGALVVLDGDRRPIGIVTDRDLALRVLAADGPPPGDVAHVMTPSPAKVPEDMPIEDALEKMRVEQTRRLVVVDGAGRLAGLATLDDILMLLGEESARIARLLAQQTARRPRGGALGGGSWAGA